MHLKTRCNSVIAYRGRCDLIAVSPVAARGRRDLIAVSAIAGLGAPARALVVAATVSLAAATLSVPVLAQTGVQVEVVNPLEVSRTDEVVAIPWSDLAGKLSGLDPDAVRVVDASGNETTVQVVDSDGDGAPDELLFLVDLRPAETRTFRVEPLAPRSPAVARAYAAHVPARDDVAWESDRIGYRTYGQGLWNLESLVSSGIDVWTKRTDDLVIDSWYGATDASYHVDTGEGADFFSVGPTLGNGGNAAWVDGRLYRAENFANHRIIADGPIRAIVELEYEPWDAGGRQVSQTRRITIDAGQNLYREDLTFDSGDSGPIEFAIGFVKRPDGLVGSTSSDSGFAWVSVWGPVAPGAGGHGDLGGGLVSLVDAPLDYRELDDHYVAIFEASPGETVTNYIGAGWTASGQYRSVQDWWDYLDDLGARLVSPVRVRVLD